MAEISPSFAVAIFLIWPTVTGFTMWKYLGAFKQKKRLDSWMWFFTWAMCITAIQWWVLSVMMVFNVVF